MDLINQSYSPSQSNGQFSPSCLLPPPLPSLNEATSFMPKMGSTGCAEKEAAKATLKQETETGNTF